MRISKCCIYEIILFHAFLAFFVLSFPRKDEWGITVFLFLVILVLLILEYCRTKIFVSPLFFWFGFWLGAITIGRMHLGIGVYPLYREWTERLLRIIILNTLVFFWAYWLGESCFFRKKAAKNRIPDINGEMLATVVILLLLIACFSFLVNVAVTGVIPQLTGNANAYRSSFVATRYYKIVSILRCVLACVPISYKLTCSRTKKGLLLILTGMFFLAEMLTGWRGYTLQGMILFLSSFLIISGTDKKARVRNFIIVCSAVLVAMAFIIYITVTRDGSFEVVEERVNYAINTFYLYIAPNFLNFQSAVEKVHPKGYLMYTLESVWGMVIPAWENPLYIWDDVEYSIGAYNVCTYLLEPYCDLGIIGTAIWSALIAAFSGKAFQLVKTKKTAFAFVALGISNITIFMLHNNFFLRSSSFLIWIVLGFLISRFSMVRIGINGKKII